MTTQCRHVTQQIYRTVSQIPQSHVCASQIRGLTNDDGITYTFDGPVTPPNEILLLSEYNHTLLRHDFWMSRSNAMHYKLQSPGI